MQLTSEQLAALERGEEVHIDIVYKANANTVMDRLEQMEVREE